jgi:penicillin amidase
VLRRSLQDAVEEGQRIQGRKVARWDWGAYNRLLLAHPVGSRLPLVSQYFNIGPVDQSGSSLTVKQTTRRLGPSMRFAADTADWDNSELTLVTGVSAHVLSSHYKDNWESYYAGRGLPFRYRRPEIRSALTISPRR